MKKRKYVTKDQLKRALRYDTMCSNGKRLMNKHLDKQKGRRIYMSALYDMLSDILWGSSPRASDMFSGWLSEVTDVDCFEKMSVKGVDVHVAPDYTPSTASEIICVLVDELGFD